MILSFLKPKWLGPRSFYILLLLGMVAFTAQGQPMRVRQFPPGSLGGVGELPQSRFRIQLERLPGPAQERALGWLRSFHFTEMDLESLHVDADGGIYYADILQLEPVPAAGQQEPVVAAAAVPISPFPANLILHSRPGAPNVLYLNFCGENVSNTAWNNSLGRTVIPTVAFSTDADFTTFSDAEQLAIRRIWQRVGEDYAPFDVDVTTERPATFGTRTGHALITRSTDTNEQANPSSTAGGVAYVGVFGTSSYANYRPAWIYYNNLGNNESYTAEATSHELGHNLGLSHDGRTDGLEYYGGHGTGDTSWGPLMGTGYSRNVSQWSKGEYYLANNTQDDLAIIAGKIAYRTDDHGNTLASATALVIMQGTNILVTTPENDPANTNRVNKGVIGRTTDVDVFSFVTGNGPINLAVNPWIMPSGVTRGGNLDVVAELYNQGGSLLITSSGTGVTYARIQTNLTEGQYYLLVRNTDTGDPFSSTPTGYTTYGSIGQYFITGTVVASSLVIPPTAVLQITDVALPGVGTKQFTVTYTDNAGIDTGTIDGNDIRVTGPNGYARLARFVFLDVTSSGTPRVATYAVDPPSGLAWVTADNGTYTVWMQTNQVADTEGAWVAAGQLGQFVVDVPVPIYAAKMDTDPGWTLEPLWQYGAPAYAGTGPTGGHTGTKIIGYDLSANYENRLTMKYATTPPINCSGSSSLTLRFYRWLRLRNGDTASIQVSTNATAWTDVWSTTRTVLDNNWQELQYALPSWAAGSPSVRLRWGMGSGPSQNEIGWNIDDVEVLAGGTLDTLPPSASLSVANITSGGSPNQSFTVTYTDNAAVRISTLTSSNVVVSGPNGYSNVVDFVGADTPTDAATCTASYSIPAPGGAWDPADNGAYQLILQDGQVTDIYNNPIPETVLGSFTVAIPASQQVLVVSPTVLTVVEGSNAVFTIRLSEQPPSPVTVTVTRVSGDTNLVVQNGETLVFDATSWSSPVPVTLAALPDTNQVNGTAVFECRATGITPVNVLATEQDTNVDNNVALTVTVNRVSWGTVSSIGGVYDVGSEVQVSATPAPYFRFVGWSGGVMDTNNPLTLVLSTNLSIEADFAEILTTNHPTPLWWLASNGYAQDFEAAVDLTGANGYLVWQSYIAGFNPGDPGSQLRLVADRGVDGTNQVLNWNPVSGRVYTVLWSTNVLNGFVPLPGAVGLPAPVSAITNSIEPQAPAVFYRVQVEKP